MHPLTNVTSRIEAGPATAEEAAIIITITAEVAAAAEITTTITVTTRGTEAVR